MASARKVRDLIVSFYSQSTWMVPRDGGIPIAAQCGTRSLAADRVDEGSVASDIPYFDAGPLPTLSLCTPLERRIAERAGLGEIESPGKGFLAIAPDDLTESEWKGPLNPGFGFDN